MGYPSYDYSFEQYQKEANEPHIYPVIGEKYVFPLIGLVGEVGEVSEKIKKILRDKDGVVSEEDQKEIAKELGDVLWYLSQLATELDISLEHIAKENIRKITRRKEQGTIQSNGDNR